MTFALRVRMQMARGAVVRLVRLVEHRSARILEIDVRGDSTDGRATVDLIVRSRLSAAALARQIEKLYDVEAVDVTDTVGADHDEASAPREGKDRFRC